MPFDVDRMTPRQTASVLGYDLVNIIRVDPDYVPRFTEPPKKPRAERRKRTPRRMPDA